MSKVVSIVLAAGLSTRMAPAHKLLQPLSGHTVLGLTLTRLDASTVDEILVVVGHRGVHVAKQAVDVCPRCSIVQAASPGDGLAATLAAGLARLAVDASGVLICLADMPLVRTETIEALLVAFRTSRYRQPIIAPFRDGRRGNPVLWHRAHVPKLARLSGDEGGRHLIKARAADLEVVETDDPGIFIDIDTPAALDLVRAELCAET